MGIDGKYGRVETERGTIGEDEPVVVFRAQDKLLTRVLEYYHDLCNDAGSPLHHLARIQDTIYEVKLWQDYSQTKIPTSDMLDPSKKG